MPYNLDFSLLKNVKAIQVGPKGWASPLFVEYGILDEDMPLYCWRVRGTAHTFKIPVVRMDFLSSGDYKNFFGDALEVFREDYLTWKAEGFVDGWPREYERQYSGLILV